MSYIRLERFAAAAGILTVLMIVANIILSPGSNPSDSAATIAATYMHNRQAALAWNYEDALTTLVFVCFLASIWTAMRRKDPDSDLLGAVLLFGGAGFIGTAFMGQAATAALAYKVAGQGDLGVVRMLSDLITVRQYLGLSAVSLVIFATSISAIRSSLLPRWLGWAGLVPGTFTLFAGLGVISPGPDSPLGMIEVFGVLLFLVWMLATSIALVRSTSGNRQVHAPDLARPITA